ncbi:DUF1489 domain-containing protein [Xinfangfangia sp. CPCC 101601]|uniref:DUF1489 domain-containing protein n=1 Tax=Pseudogemmobacter lacusdianii TaxID=3069608 RepID=A0ABU0VYZ1_9RHOB|nr:DUF1489 domain-containing protein [Xinfangfangia sp. CPCC 101601]MDQ2066929.1 DUF1489 domain-containing protein [Xinfangfangia sp. CPCC 101601]
MALNILKLCVGAESIEDLEHWQQQHAAVWPAGRAAHVTRMWPKREAELLDGGSLYWVIKGIILCRQRLLGFEERVGGDGITRCALIMDREIIRTEPAPRRAFQGWRYIESQDAPADLAAARAGDDSIPLDLARALAEIGLR